MPLTPPCHETHRRIAAGVCPWCRRVISNGGVKWHRPPRSAPAEGEFPPLTAEYGLSLLAWEEEGTLQGFRRSIAEEEAGTPGHQRFGWEAFLMSTLRMSERLDWISRVGFPVHKLEPWEADRLEGLVDREPAPLWLRVILLANHRSRPDCAASRGASRRHALWIIERFPWSSIAAILDSCFEVGDGAYDEAKWLWVEAITARPEHLGILDSASRFFALLDPVLRGEFLRRGKALEPDEPNRSRRLGLLYLQEMRSRQDESRRDWAAMALCELLPDQESWEGELKKPYMLPILAETAFEAGQLDRAAEIARRMVEEHRHWWPSSHNAHQLLGRIALRSGDVEGDKAHLLESARRDQFPRFGYLPANMMLARELLERGEKETVLHYLALHSTDRPSEQEKMAEWVAQIERGEIPDFGCRKT